MSDNSQLTDSAKEQSNKYLNKRDKKMKSACKMCDKEPQALNSKESPMERGNRLAKERGRYGGDELLLKEGDIQVHFLKNYPALKQRRLNK